MTRILIVQGHPDHGSAHFCHALAASYAAGARSAGHAVNTLDVAALDFPLLRRPSEWETAEPPAAIADAQKAIVDAELAKANQGQQSAPPANPANANK